jgi:hypothetical protein
MATFDDVTRVATALPEVREGERHGNLAWRIGEKVFAWERPFSKADIKRFNDETPPDGPILAVRVGDLGEKEAVLAAHPEAFFTIPHFDGYPAILIQLTKVSPAALTEAITDGWLACAPPKLAGQYGGLHEGVLIAGYDPHAKRHQRDRDDLETGEAQRDADDRQAQRDASQQMPKGQPPAEQQDPEDVPDQRADPRIVSRLDRPAERPEHVVRDPEGRDPERDRDDQDQSQKTGNCVHDR